MNARVLPRDAVAVQDNVVVWRATYHSDRSHKSNPNPFVRATINKQQCLRNHNHRPHPQRAILPFYLDSPVYCQTTFPAWR